MIPIKIQCGCGQRYAFEVEPSAGQVPAVACPACGMDGTDAANSALAQYFAASSGMAAPSVAAGSAAPSGGAMRVGVATTTPSATSSAPSVTGAPGRPKREQAETEARAKIMWGDEQQEVIKYLLTQGYSGDEARTLVAQFFDERAKTIRQNGISKTFTGIGMILVPIIAWTAFKASGIIPLKLFGITLAIGAWGVWRVVSGVIMFLSPRSESGDVSEQ
jgi:hypothetical protein